MSNEKKGTLILDECWNGWTPKLQKQFEHDFVVNPAMYSENKLSQETLEAMRKRRAELENELKTK